MTPTARTLRMLRSQGATVAVVEKFNPGARVRQDLFRFIDVVALEPGKVGLLGVQTTSASNQASRVTKIQSEPNAALWLACGNRIQVHGWAKRGERGKRKRWTATVKDIDLVLMAAPAAEALRGERGRSRRTAEEAEGQ